MKTLLLPLLVCFGLATVDSARAQFVFTPSFPSGVDWSNATPDQISEAVYNAVKDNPDQAVEITKAAIEASKNTGRFPSIASSDGKQYVGDPESIRDGSIEDVAVRIGEAAKSANPSLAPQIDAAVVSLVPTVTMLPPSSSGGTTSGGGTTTGGGVPLPGGFTGGGGSTTNPTPTPDSN